ncbi:MAG: DUF938 domain-containing protein [Pseudomonadota bacterium]
MTWLSSSNPHWGPPQAGDDAPPGALFAPAAARNVTAVCDAVRSVLAGAEGTALEIGSGTGQHICALAHALPALTWLPSDPAPEHRVSIAAWSRQVGAANLRAPIALDAAAPPPWPLTSLGLASFGSASDDLANQGVAHAAPDDAAATSAQLSVIYCANVIHISPPTVLAGILAGAGHHLAQGGRLIFYGPFARDGAHTAPSNAAFDTALRARDPQWGVRDLTDVISAAAGHGLEPDDVIDMPANNLLVVLHRRETRA